MWWTAHATRAKMRAVNPLPDVPLLPRAWRAPAFWILLAAAAGYVAFLGACWLPLAWSDKELAASASRVWDIQQEWRAHGELPWWTPSFMSGSSYGLNYARGFHLLPWLLLTPFFSLAVAGKLMALASILAGAIGMFFCARYFLKHDGAALLAGLAFLLHPEQLTRAATQEHMPIITFIPFIPLVWWRFARALDEGRWRNVFLCALVVVLGMWADVKQLVVQGVFLTAYLGFWCWRHRSRVTAALRTCAQVTGASFALGAFIIVPGLTEQPFIKLFLFDPLREWQKTYALHSPLALVDRDGGLTRASTAGIRHAIETGAIRPVSREQAEQLQTQIGEVMSLQMDSPEKYAGLVVLALIVVAALFNSRRQDQPLFWFALTMLLLAVMIGAGRRNVWTATTTVFGALWDLPGVTSGMQLAVVVLLGVVVAGLVVLARRKIKTPRQWWLVGGVLAAFLFVPGFELLAALPYFKEIRAPGVFYALPFAFFGALLAGFFVTDFLPRRHLVAGLGGLAALLLLDYWPYQRSVKDNGVPAQTLRNLEASYSALKADPLPGKTYALTGRYFHLLGPQYSGRPQVYEAFYNWMAPQGIGFLNQQAFASWEGHRAFLNLLGASHVVFDKSDPNNQSPNVQQIAQMYRRDLPVVVENADFVIFRNPTAWAPVTAFARGCGFVGDFRESAPLAIALAAQGWPLVHRSPNDSRLGRDSRVYPGATGLPATKGLPVTLADLQVQRESHMRLRVRATTPADCLVVINESFYPYWRATVDGQPADLLRVSTGLMGLELPAGKHEIALRYEPPRRYAVAGLVSLVALVAGLALALRSKA